MRAKKRFGQVFLTNPHHIHSLLQSIPSRPDGTFIEIGPGPGALTAGLCAKCRRLVAIEVDPEACAELRERMKGTPHIDIIQADILKTDLAPFRDGKDPLCVVGNLPYNIASLILLKLVRCHDFIREAYVTVQREVAERLVAPPGVKAYSFLSAAVASFASAKRLRLLPPGAFCPAPKVESAFLRLQFREDPAVAGPDIDAYLELVSRAFSRRRKKVLKVLSESYPPDALEAYFRMNGIDGNARAENLSAERFSGLFHFLRAAG